MNKILLILSVLLTSYILKAEITLKAKPQEEKDLGCITLLKLAGEKSNIAGEMINKKNLKESLKPALGSLLGILIGSGIKFCLSLVYLFFYLNIFWNFKDNFF